MTHIVLKIVMLTDLTFFKKDRFLSKISTQTRVGSLGLLAETMKISQQGIEKPALVMCSILTYAL